MSKQAPTPKLATLCEEDLSKTLLGKIPLFFHEVVIQEKSSTTTAQTAARYSRSISVAEFQTDAFESRAYHKPISKIV